MSGNVAVLAVRLEAQSAAFRRQMQDASGTVTRFAGTVQNAFSGLRGAIAAFGAGFGVYRIVDSLRETAQEMEDILDIAETFGLSVESLSRLKHAADINHASFDALTKSIAFQQRSLRAARDGAAEAARTYERLGLDIGALTRMRAEDAFVAVAESLRRIEDPATRTQAMFRLLGRSAIAIADTVLLGEEGLRRMAEQADRLGITFDAGAGHVVNAMNESMRALSGAFEGMRRSAVTEIAPIITGVADAMTEWMASGEGVGASMRAWMDAAIEKAAQLERAFRAVGDAISPIGRAIGGMARIGSRAADAANAASNFAAGVIMSPISLGAKAVGGVARMFGAERFADMASAFGGSLMESTRESMLASGDAVNRMLGASAREAAPQQTTAADMLKRVPSAIERFRERGKALAERANADAAIAAQSRQSAQEMQEMIDAEERRVAEMKAAAQRVALETRTPEETFADKQRELNALLDDGMISWETYSRAMAKAVDELKRAASATDRAAASVRAFAGSGDLDKIAFAFTGGAGKAAHGAGGAMDGVPWIKDPLETPIGGWNPVALRDALAGKAAHDIAYARAAQFVPNAMNEMLEGGPARDGVTGAPHRIEQLDTTNEYLRTIANAIASRGLTAVAA